MRFQTDQIQLSATDLAKHLACRHLTALDLLVATGKIKPAHRNDPTLAVLEERGLRHEADYLLHLKDSDYQVLFDESGLDGKSRLQRTVDAMTSGMDVIAQADLKDGRRFGRADVLLKVDRPSKLGNWSYEVVDTKLARETRAAPFFRQEALLVIYSMATSSPRMRRAEWNFSTASIALTSPAPEPAAPAS